MRMAPHMARRIGEAVGEGESREGPAGRRRFASHRRMRVALALTAFVAAQVIPAALRAWATTPSRSARLPAEERALQCVSDVVVSRPNAKEMVKPGRERAILVEAIGPCEGALKAMIREHDQVYGPGTGLAYYRGPFLKRLPRDVQARVKTRL